MKTTFIRDLLKKSKFTDKVGHWIFTKCAILLTWISPKLNTMFIFWVRFGHLPNLKNPQTSNEKVMYLKLNKFNNDPLSITCADKYAVRQYVKDCGLENLLIPLLAVYDSPEKIEWDLLPKRFFLKWNFGSGLNIRCEDIDCFDKNKAICQLKKWRNNKDHLVTSELQYCCPKKLIIVEQNMATDSHSLPQDYKVYCFNGKAEYVLLCIGRQKIHDAKFYMLDRDKNFHPSFTYDGISAPSNIKFEIPNQFGELLQYAEKLSKPFTSVS